MFYLRVSVLFLFLSSFGNLAKSQDNSGFIKQVKLESEQTVWLRKGYLNAKVAQNDSNETIEKGTLFRIKSIVVKDSTQPIAHLTNYVESFLGKPSSDSIFTEILLSLSEELRFTDYLKSEVVLDSISINRKLAETELFVLIKDYKKSLVQDVVFKGNTQYSKDYLQKVSGLKPPGRFTANDLKRAQIRLGKSHLFSTVSDAKYEKFDSLITVSYRVVEQNPNRFDLILGYVPKQSGGGEVVGNVDLDLLNFMVEGSQVGLSYQRLEALKTRVHISVSQHYLFNLPASVGIRFDLYQRDSTFQSQNWVFNATFDVNNNSTVGGSLRFDEIGSGMSALQTVSNGNALYYGFFYELDFRDDIYVPISGWYAILKAEFGKKMNQQLSDSSWYPKKESKQSFELHLNTYFSVFKRHIFVGSIHGYVLLSKFYQESDLFRLGGAQSFRGFNEEQFGVSKTGWADVEYRFLLDRTSYLFAFHSRGWLESPELKFETGFNARFTKQLQSFGMGLAYKTRLGLLTFTYAKSPEDSFDNAKIHFGIRGNL